MLQCWKSGQKYFHSLCVWNVKFSLALFIIICIIYLLFNAISFIELSVLQEP